MTISTALTNLKTALGSIDPSPQPVPNAVYLWPDDQDTMVDVYPFIVVEHSIYETGQFIPSVRGAAMHRWFATVTACLADGQLSRAEALGTAEEKQEPWIMAISRILAVDRSLGGEVLAVGQNSLLWDYRIGNVFVPKWNNKSHWGLRFRIAMMQEVSLPGA